MEYFMLCSEATNQPGLLALLQEGYMHLLSDECFRRIPDSGACYYEFHDDIEEPALMTTPLYLCNEELKHILQVYDPAIQWKNLFLLPPEAEKVKGNVFHYFIPNFRRIDCIHEDAKILPNGIFEEVILDQKKIQNLPVFQVVNDVENYVVVSLTLAESISRRNLYGIKLKRVEVR